MDLHARYPSVPYLKAKAKKRLPHFVWEFLNSGTGSETALHNNRAALDEIRMMPAILKGDHTPDLGCEILGQKFDLPLGIAPVGMSGLIWPDAEHLLAQAAATANIPYTLSTVAATTPEAVAPVIGDNAWFQLYPPRDPDIRRDMLRRARAAGFETLVLTVDIPVASRRERQMHSGLTTPPRLTPRLLWQILQRPAWATAFLGVERPRMRMIDDYMGNVTGLATNAHAGYLIRTAPDGDYLRAVRAEWHGPLIVKGVMNPDDIAPLEAEGINAIWVSNHGGRQFDGVPASIDMLSQIRDRTKLPLIIDSGFEGGLDILRAISLGADLIMFGRAFHYALAALSSAGPTHLIDILRQDLMSNMGQLGVQTLKHVT